MPVKGNQFKSNNFKPENQPRQSSSRAEREKQPKQKAETRRDRGVMNSQVIKITGLFSLLLSVYFLVAFTSYLFTWKDDQSYVSPANGGWSNFNKTTQELVENGVKNPIIENWLGKLGALLSNQFIYEWFGVASFLFVLVFFVIGYRLLFRVSLLSISKTLAYSFFFIVFISVSIGFFHAFIADTPNYLEGNFGFWSNRLLDAQVGQTGTAGILVFAALAVLVIAYNIDFKLPARKEKELTPELQSVQPGGAEAEDEEISVPLEWPGGRANKLKDNPENSARAETLKQAPLVQNPVFHEPVVLTPNAENGSEPEFEDEIPLTVGVTRPTPELNIEKSDHEKAKSLVDQFGKYDHTLELASYKYPTLDLLENYGSNKINVHSDELAANKNKIVETLNHYNIEIDKIKATIGPTVTLYEIIPAPGVRISKIKNLEDDIALSLAALGIRIIAPMPGKGTIGIEVPNQSPEMVSMR
ncbi:MAG TPA: DNA translocase FtsK 4TM domain-containing protein, partial [Mucilaginibacter sp.]|nr:DNA translocase FtsK 4TM domain-containing protein [Mucilaginibacter sp.]